MTVESQIRADIVEVGRRMYAREYTDSNAGNISVRLGDDIDDFCVRCKRVMNHAVVSVVNGIAAKVRCRTCHNDHDFRHEQPPPPKADSRKAALFNEVLKTVDPSAAPVELDAEGAELETAELEPVEEGVEEGAEEQVEQVEPAAKAAAAAERSTSKTSKTASKSAPKGKSKAKK